MSETSFKTERFYSPTKGRMSFEEVICDVVRIMESDLEAPYAIVVGTDSHSSVGEVDFVSAIIIHRLGKGGRYFWRRTRESKIHTLRQKIYREATLSFELAKAVMEELKDRTLLDYNLEIHVDVGERGKTKELIDEVVGMIVGSGFSVKTKPDAYAASSVADKHT
ncbi:ribonuclease H-like YkuK family protein [Candidatus Acetothermia bacterium]|nr:ribonuclease H-like YkuK family protein [Candidatus Acetothermia bacterium]MBI3643757.1 ribonuclease H-like YkuK family protein [Candidatus Acetothermia bacterium]